MPKLLRSLPLLMLFGCDRAEVDLNPHAGGGRFFGLAAYPAGALWSHMKLNSTADPSAATIRDDEHIIVVVDSSSGEVRQCGDLSGVCRTMNPWRRPSPTTADAVKLDIHAAELAAQQSPEGRTSPSTNSHGSDSAR